MTGDPLPYPVQVMLARRVEELPAADALPGGCAWEPKLDGHRLVVLTSPVRLQTRSGRDVTERFPEIAEAAGALPPGTVLDGELVVWLDGKVDFQALQTRANSPRRRTPPANYAAFDVLALDGADWRPRPYGERRPGLEALLGPLGPPLQAVPMTLDRETARQWYDLRAGGVEGLVAKGLAQPYRPGRRGWLKIRHMELQDAMVVGVTGPVARPTAAVVDFGDGPVLSARLAPLLRRQLGEAATTGRASVDDVDYRPLVAPLPAEVRHGDTRHTTAAVIRLREDLAL
ncbi:ATP-dependent DNA ligase [Streptomyces sp. NPDC051976]|uniref:ATP-dependent DNA ligase n=1 Tax=Streptomyces sp. NPDC051976 TaxID=3154947 RepID=UPI00341F5E57